MSDRGSRVDFVALALGDAAPAPMKAYAKIKVVEVAGNIDAKDVLAWTRRIAGGGERHVVYLPAAADIEVGALEIVQGALHLHGEPMARHGFDYALLELLPLDLEEFEVLERIQGLTHAYERNHGWLDPGRDLLLRMRGGLESATVGADDGAPPRAHWNTRLLDGERALIDPFVEVGHRYTIESGLAAYAVADAIAGGEIGFEIEDGTEVTFVIACTRAILHDPETPAAAATTRVASRARYVAATQTCGPVRIGVVPDAPGPVTITLDLVTGNSTRVSSKVPLWVGAGAPAMSPIVPTAVTAASLGGPKAELQLELLPSGELALSGGAMTGIPCRPASADAAIATAAILARQQLVALSHRYQPDPARPFAIADGAAMQHAMAKIGAALHAAIFGHPDDESVGAEIKKLAQAIADTPPAGETARLQIKAAFQPFPWGVFYDGVYRGTPLTDDPASVDPRCFWGRRFRIDRAIYGHVVADRAPTIASPVRVQTCLNPHLDAEQGAFGVKVVEQQRALFDGFAAAERRTPVETAAGFKTYVQAQPGGPCDLLYVFCHATAAHVRDDLFTFTGAAPDTQAKLVFEPGGAVDVATMKALRMKPLPDRPLVMLNACSSAQGDEAFQAPMLEHFLDRWKALGVIGTDWEVPTVFADAFARTLFGYFVGGRKPLGEALARAAADAFGDGNPFPLIYAVYARPDIVLQEE